MKKKNRSFVVNLCTVEVLLHYFGIQQTVIVVHTHQHIVI